MTWLRALWRRRIIRWTLYVVVLAFIIINVVLPFGMGIFATIAPHDSVGVPPDGFEAVSLTSSDGVELAGWYAPPQNGAVIILLHGAGNSREGVRALASMLVEHRFGVLAYDQRGHGESNGQTNLVGWAGSRDVSSAISFLQTQPDVTAIGGLGLSLGGEVLLGAVSENPDLLAVVSDGATFRFYDEYNDLPSNSSILTGFPVWIMSASVRIFSGDTPPLPILDSITNSSAQLLLIAAGNVGDEIDYNTLFAEAVGERATVWVVPDVGHTDGFQRYPDEYTRRVIAFFEQTLIDTSQ